MIEQQLKEKLQDRLAARSDRPGRRHRAAAARNARQARVGRPTAEPGRARPSTAENLGATLTDEHAVLRDRRPDQVGSQPADRAGRHRIRAEPTRPSRSSSTSFRDRTFHSQISEIAKVDLKVAPRNLSSKTGGEVVTKTDESGAERPQNTSYEARAPIDDPEAVLAVGLKGRAKICTHWQSLGSAAWRYLTRTFNFKM